MKIVAIVQARISSSRLPRKVMADIEGEPMLSHVLRRVAAAKSVDEVSVATTTNPSDDAIVAIARNAGHRWFRGDEHDVLSRYVGAAREASADVVVRITSDCPLIDPAVIDRVVDELASHAPECDYASNVTHRSFPRGLDVEAMFRDALDRTDRFAQARDEREHVTMAIYASRAAHFLRRDVVDAVDNSDLRWTVDYPVDLEVVRIVYRQLRLAERPLPFREVVRWFRDNGSIAARNADLVTWSPTVGAENAAHRAHDHA
jgi:spore coat polysaccharide biosynthesis protein SpsF